jgi:hypothetical protein
MAGAGRKFRIFQRLPGDSVHRQPVQCLIFARRPGDLPIESAQRQGEARAGVAEAKTEQLSRWKRAMMGKIHAT